MGIFALRGQIDVNNQVDLYLDGLLKGLIVEGK